MKTFEDSARMILICEDVDATEQIKRDKIQPFFDEAESNPAVRVIMAGISEHLVLFAAGLPEECHDDWALMLASEYQSWLVTVLLYGVAIGREMEKVDMESLVQ